MIYLYNIVSKEKIISKISTSVIQIHCQFLETGWQFCSVAVARWGFEGTTARHLRHQLGSTCGGNRTLMEDVFNVWSFEDVACNVSILYMLCAHMYIYIYNLYNCICVCVNVCECMWTWVNVCECMSTFEFVCECIWVYVNVCKYVKLQMYANVCLCVCVCKHMHT